MIKRRGFFRGVSVICFLYFLPFIVAAADAAAVVRPATCCWSAVTVVRVKTAATNTAKTVDETRAMAIGDRTLPPTRQQPVVDVSESRDVLAAAVFVGRPFVVARPRGTGSPVSDRRETQIGYRKSTRARRTTCSVRRRHQ